MSNPYDPQEPRPGGATPPPQAPSWPPAPDQGQTQQQPSYGEPTQQIPSTPDQSATQPLAGGGYGATPVGGDQGGYGATPAGGYGAALSGGYGAQQPGYGAPAAGYGVSQGGPAQQGTNGLAIASLVSGVLGFLCLTAIAAVVLGVVALGQIRRTGKKGKGLAIAGIVLGVLWLLGAIVLVPAGIAAYERATDTETTATADPAPTPSSETTEPSTTTSPEPTTETTSEPPVETAVVLAAGDCISDPAILTGGDVPQSAVVDCAEPHYAEAYAEFELPESTYPGEEAVTLAAEQGCDTEFEPFVGLPYQESVFEVFYYYPTEESWDVDRGVVCVLLDPSGEPVTGSLQGAGR